MATLTISLTSTPATGSKAYTVSDADVQSILNWAKVAFPVPAPDNRTNAQLLMAWVQAWINGTKSAVQQFQTPPAVVPPQISIT